MKKLVCLGLLLIIAGSGSYAQNECSSAGILCSGASVGRTTIGATVTGSDPALSCGDMTLNNNVWFYVIADTVGNCTITVNNINNNPGLDMEVYTGSCGSLVSTGNCASGSSLTGGSMSVSFTTAIGTTYYIMIDGSAGNQEAFDIIATSPNNAIVGRPEVGVITDAIGGCIPLTVNFDGTINFHGGTNQTLDWRINTGPFIPATSPDTAFSFTTATYTDVLLRVCNEQCGCRSEIQTIESQELSTSIQATPPNACIGTPTTFICSGTLLPDPTDDPNLFAWEWDFGDPASGGSNTASGNDTVTHVFVGTPPFTVRCIAQGTCGPDTSYYNINPPPAPTVIITGPTIACEGIDINLGSSTTNATMPVNYTWSGAGSLSCSSCSSTILNGLAAGGPYTIDLDIVDALGCTADTSIDITINELPTIFAGGIITVCANDSAQLNALAANGLAPYEYDWSPTSGLSNATIANPYTFNTNGTSYCVTATDANGCTSTPDCVTINQYPQPVINPSSANLCATQTPLQNTFTVAGAGPGSNYSWRLSPDYSLITGAAADSSDITADFPAVPGTYNFTAIVSDGVTGCIDTVQTSFTVTAGLIVSIGGPAVICEGDNTTLTASGATTYMWSSSPAYPFGNPSDAAQNVAPVTNTVFTVVGTQGTCSATVTHTLDVGALPDAGITPIPDYCGCDTVTLDGSGSTAGMTYLWTSSLGNPIADPNDIATTAYLCGVDNITLVVTDTSTGCFSDSTFITTVRTNPAAQVAVTPDLICIGDTTFVQFDAAGSDTTGNSFAWTSSDASVTINDTSSKDTTSATVWDATVFYLTVTNSFGCDTTVSDTVLIYPPPSFTANPPFLCSTDPDLDSTQIVLSGASPATAYYWDSIPACAVPNSIPDDTTTSQWFDLSGCPVGAHNFVVTVNDSTTGCSTVVTETVNIVSGVTLTYSNDTSFCEGGIATLWASGANTYLWSGGPTTDTINISGLDAANSPYDIIVIGYVGSCSDTDTVRVTVFPVPATGPINGLSSVCEADPVTQYSVAPPSANTFTWTVSGGAIQIGQGMPDVFVNWNSVGLDTISVIETNSDGCSGPQQMMTVLVNPLPPAPSVSGPDTVCNDEVHSYFVNPTAGSIYTWTVGGGNSVTGNIGTVNTVQWTTPGGDSLTVYEQTAAGCIGPLSTYDVFVNPRPASLSVSGSTLVCDNDSAIYTLTANPGSVYTWNVVSAQQQSVNAATDSLSVYWGISGTAHIYVFETASTGCNSDTLDLTVSVSQAPQLFVPIDTADICNSPYQVIASGTGINIRWYTDGAGTFSDTTIAAPVYFPDVTDVGTIHLTMLVSSPPCSDTSTTITLNILPSPVVSISGPTAPLCFGIQDTLIATGGGTYIWLPGGIPFDTIGVRPLQTTTYTVAVTNNFNCTTSDTFTVFIEQPGIPDAGSDQSICSGDTALLSGSVQNATGIEWTTRGDGYFVPDSLTPNAGYVPGANDSLSGSVTLVITSTGACLNLMDSMIVDIELQPYMTSGNDTTLSDSKDVDAVALLELDTTNVSGVIWTTSGTGTFNPSNTSFSGEYIPSDADLDLDSIILIVSTVGGCTVVIDSMIIDFTPFQIPNVFSPYPATPGQNDYFVITDITPNSKLKIWDRWGELVYTSEYYQNDWDAYGLKSGVYYYMFVAEGAEYKGWVQVMKED